MEQATLRIRMDADLKRQFDDFCEEVGMNASVAVNLFAKAVVREGKIPFDIAADPFWSAANQAVLSRSIAQWDAGMGKCHELIETEEHV